MKWNLCNRVLMASILAVISQSVAAQFSFTKDGMKSSEDKAKSFVVFDYGTKTKNDIYTKAITAVTGIYVSPKDVISKVENEAISINGILQDIPLGKKKALDDLEMNYTLKLNFKDGKMRAEIFINKLQTSYSELLKKRIDLAEREYGKVFSSNGEPNYTLTIETIDVFFNGIMKKVGETIEGKENEDW